jgi:hypothetical protein
MAKLKGLWITLGIITGVIGIPIAVLYGCFYDNTTASFQGDDQADNAQLFANEAVDAFDPCLAESKISYNLSEDTLNQLLYTASKSLGSEAQKYLKKFTLSIQADSYHFYLDLKVPLFESRLDLTCKLKEIGDPATPEEGAFQFQITNVRLGRIDGMDSIALGIAGNFINDATLTDAFSSAGLHMSVALAEKTITYKKSDMIADLKAKMANGGSDQNIYFTVLDDFLKDGLLDFNFYQDKQVAVGVDLTKVHRNETYCPSDRKVPFDLGVYRDQLKILMDGQKIPLSEDAEEFTFDYLVRGYQHCGSDAQSFLNQSSFDFSSIGITDIKTYAGAPNYNVPTIPSLVEADVKAAGSSGFSSPTISSLSEEEITAYLITTKIYGYSYILSRENDAKNGYKVNYIAVDDFYSEIVDDHLYLIVGVNMNGYETSIIFDTAQVKNSEEYKITLATSKVYYGGFEASGNLKSLFYDLINQSFDGSNWVSFNNNKTSAEYGQIAIDFEQAITDSGYKNALKLSGKTVHVAFKGTDVAAAGTLEITAE